MMAKEAPLGAFFSGGLPVGKGRLVSPFWLTVWALAVSWCWLLPNHYPPWSAFHMDAWAAAALLPMAAAVLWRTQHDHQMSVLAASTLIVSLLPGLQYFGGLIEFSGSAWLAFAYLLAFSLAIVVGSRWERQTPDQLGDGLFLAIGVAALLSVGIQLHQWLGLNIFEVWLMADQSGRPFANFAQPNQMATFLLWGLLALAWGGVRGHIRPTVMVFAATYLLFGLALTSSRTAWLGICILGLASWLWRTLLPWRRGPWVTSFLTAGFFATLWILPAITQALLLDSRDQDFGDLVRLSGESRPQIWAMFLQAATLKPWIGYGWNQVSYAHLAVATEYPALAVLFAHSHNLFLDLMLWCGVPLGLLLSFGLCLWFWRRLRAVADAQALLLFLLVAVVANHALLELPLHYAYFLLPTGLAMGALDSRTSALMLSLRRAWVTSSTWLVCITLLGFVVYDYMRIEASYQVLRFEWAGVRSKADRNPPDVFVLDQLRALIVYARFEPTREMPNAKLEWMRKVASVYPSSGVIHKYAVALAWNGQPDEAAIWLRRMCAMSPASQCGAIKRSWQGLAAQDAAIASVDWK
jgi:O-antigen ligase